MLKRIHFISLAKKKSREVKDETVCNPTIGGVGFSDYFCSTLFHSRFRPILRFFFFLPTKQINLFYFIFKMTILSQLRTIMILLDKNHFHKWLRLL